MARYTKNRRPHRFSISVMALERRRLLSGIAVDFSALDQYDLVGPTAGVGPDGTKDIRIEIVNIPITTSNGKAIGRI